MNDLNNPPTRDQISRNDGYLTVTWQTWFSFLKNIISSITSQITSLQTAVAAIPAAQNFVEVTAGSVNLMPNTVYIMNNPTTRIIATMPATMGQFSSFNIIGKGAAGWRVMMNPGQRTYLTTTATSSGGYIESGNQYDNMVIRCITTNVEFSATARNGSLVIT